MHYLNSVYDNCLILLVSIPVQTRAFLIFQGIGILMILLPTYMNVRVRCYEGGGCNDTINQIIFRFFLDLLIYLFVIRVGSVLT